MVNKLISIFFFCVSLQSYYFYNIGLPVISLISALFIVLIISLDKKLIVFDQSAKIVIFIYVAIIIWSYLGVVFATASSVDIKRLIGVLFIILIVSFVSTMASKYSVEQILKITLLLHITAFAFQVILYSMFDIKLDYLKLITGEEQRFYGGTFANPIYGRPYRPGGLYNEPGTYVTYIAPIVALFLKYIKKNSINKYLFYVSVISLVASSSVFGLLFAIIIIVIGIDISKFAKLLFVSMSFFILSPYLIYRFYHRRTQGLGDGFIERLEYLNIILESITSNISNFIFGNNILSTQLIENIAFAENDIGMFLYLVYFIGVPMTFMLGILILKNINKMPKNIRAAILILLFSKISIFSMSFVFILILIFKQYYESKKAII